MKTCILKSPRATLHMQNSTLNFYSSNTDYRTLLNFTSHVKQDEIAKSD